MGHFPTFKLSDKQIRGIANIVLHENSMTVAAMFAEASQIANLCEIKYGKDPVKAVKSGWYAYGTSRYNAGTSNATAIKIVKKVFLEGYRTLPRYVEEHDAMSDIISVTEGGKSVKHDKNKWKRHSTVIRNKMNSKYYFYDFPGGYKTGVDPFGYTDKKLREKYGDFCYTVEQAMNGNASSPYYPSCDKSYGSIVDALASIGVKDTSMAYRKKIAVKNGIKNYTGTVEQNIRLLAFLKTGKLIKP